MIIRLLSQDIQVHAPYLRSQAQFAARGFKFVDASAPRADVTLVSHNLFQDKKLGSFEASLEKGLNFLRTLKEPYILIDGQDSPSIIGTYETFVESDAVCLLKHALWKNKELYNEGYVGGRYYWGKSEDYGVPDQNYKPHNFAKYADRIFLTGTNWLGVLEPPTWHNYKNISKLFDISVMFGYPHPECHEFNLKPSQDFYYNRYRQPVIDAVQCSPYRVAKLYKQQRVSFEEYLQYIAHSKVNLTPFGYGEIRTGDLEGAQFGSILLKGDMGHLETYPNIYKANETYIPFRHDYEDLEAQMEYVVENFTTLRDNLVENMRAAYEALYHPEYLVDYTETLFKKLNLT